MRIFHLLCCAAGLGALGLTPTLRGQTPPATATNAFGFTGPEIFPLDNQISAIHAADIDGDGLKDIVVANNARSKINILYNQTGSTNKAAAPKPGVKRDLNELPPDARFRVDSIASEKRIAALVVEDLNGDGRTDIAYYGEPKELVVQYNEGTNGWSAPKRIPIDDGQLTANALTSGDLNGDGLPDLLLLGDNTIYFILQKPDHTLDEPERIPVAAMVRAVQVLDLNGDGRNDLLLVNWDSLTPFRVRLQNRNGRLDPEIHFPMPSIRSFTAAKLDGGKDAQIISIAALSGRASIAHLVAKPSETMSGTFRQGQFQVLPLKKTDKGRRGMLWADLNSDKLPDLLVAEPESGQLSVFFQQPDGTLGDAREFSTLTGVSEIATADWNNDGTAEVFLLSPDERQVGVTSLDENQRLPFPTLITTEGRPLAIAVGPLQPGDKPSLAVIVDQDGRRALQLVQADGTSTTQKLGENFKSNPSSIALHDVDQDGLMDVVILIPYEKVKILRQVKGQDFEEIDVAPPGGNIEQPWLSVADVDGDGREELLLAQRNFVRAVTLKPEAPAAGSTNKQGWVFQVREQINGASSSSRLTGAAAIRRGTNTVPSLFLLDAERKSLTLCERDSAGVWEVVRNVPLPVSEFNSLRPVAFGGTNANGVGFLGLNAVAWMPLHGDVWEIAELDGYETPIKDGRLTDVVTGDLNQDGRKDLVFLETGKNYLDVVEFTADRKLVPGNRWQVFEERTFRSRRSDMPEPREAFVADVTGDGKNDLIVIVHDRVLVYPQE